MDILYILVAVIIAWFFIDFVLLSWDIHKNKIIQFSFKYQPKSLKFKLPKIKAVEKESFTFFMLALFICLTLIIAEFIMSPPEITVENYIGAGIVFLAGLLEISARTALHQFFTLQVVIQEGHKLIRTGPYHIIRHPGYLALFLFLLGLGLAFSATFGLILLFLLFVPAMLYRIVKEEELMLAEFGKDYIYYMNSTKKLIPYIY